ncbi:cation:proton antiporter [Streptomyces pseudovenezuelae]|uniref:cation:proton antiporter n=1 Tax=Streptomyces pseudovenezuelae TaxID=67350 RepID=UPI0034A21086
MPSVTAPPLDAVVLGDVAIVLLAGALGARLATRLRQPAVVLEMAIGLMLGPSLLGLFPGDLPQRIMPAEARPALSALAQIGLVVFMFLAGWELDLRRLRGRGRGVGGIAALNIAVPFALGLLAATALYGRHAPKGVGEGEFAMFLATALAITAFPVLARVLRDSGLTDTQVGILAMACAAVGDVAAWCVLVLVAAMTAAQGAGGFATVLALTAAYGLVMYAVARPVLLHVLSLPGSRSGSRLLLPVVVAGALVSSWVTSWIGIHAIFGAFAFGLALPRQGRTELRQDVTEPLEKIVALLLPVYFVVTGLSVDVGTVGRAGVPLLLAIIVVATVGKLAGTVLPARMWGMSWREAGAFGTLMNTRGLTEIVVLTIGRDLGVIDTDLFSLMVVMALVTTAAAGPVLRLLGMTPKTDVSGAPLGPSSNRLPVPPETMPRPRKCRDEQHS